MKKPKEQKKTAPVRTNAEREKLLNRLLNCKFIGNKKYHFKIEK